MDTHYWTEKKTKIVTTTVTLIAQHGFHQVPTSMIARHAGVSEGTIYRHFKSKDELIHIAAHQAASEISQNIINNYNPASPVITQFNVFCRDFLISGREKLTAHSYIELYISSTYGLEYRREMLKELEDNPDAKPLFYPLNCILLQGKEQGVIKNYSFHLLGAIILGQLVFIVRDALSGLIELNEVVISDVSQACWDAIRRQ